MTSQRPKVTKREDDFFETMPMVTNPHYIYRDDVMLDELAPVDEQGQRRIAIFTLVLVAIAAIALGLLLARGLQLMNNSLAPDAPTLGSSQL